MYLKLEHCLPILNYKIAHDTQIFFDIVFPLPEKRRHHTHYKSKL